MTLLKSEMRAVLMMENTHYDFSFPSLRDDGQLVIPDLKSDVATLLVGTKKFVFG